jgi:transcriptional regulator with XRE-family HTH domain
MITLDSVVVRTRMEELGLTVMDVAQVLGVSRQTVHTLLRGDFRPLVESVEELSTALGLSLNRILVPVPSQALDTIIWLVERSWEGDARSFEVLPSEVFAAAPFVFIRKLHHVAVVPRLLVAATEVARTIVADSGQYTPRDGARLWRQSRILLRAFPVVLEESKEAFFFGADLMTEDRIRQSTPEPMAQLGVYGSFHLDDFRRHFPCAC